MTPLYYLLISGYLAVVSFLVLNCNMLYAFGRFQPQFINPDTYYLFNHVDLVITYHSGKDEDWGTAFKSRGGRIVCK